MKKSYWFDKKLRKSFEEQAEIGGYTCPPGHTLNMKQYNSLLYRTSMMQDGWDYFPVMLVKEIPNDLEELKELREFTPKFICDNDFDRVCREYRMEEEGMMFKEIGDFVFCPHLVKV